jgi:hypothetical protein
MSSIRRSFLRSGVAAITLTTVVALATLGRDRRAHAQSCWPPLAGYGPESYCYEVNDCGTWTWCCLDQCSPGVNCQSHNPYAEGCLFLGCYGFTTYCHKC